MSAINSVIFGVEGLKLSSNEIGFFKETSPLGFILFARNIDNPHQLTKLVSSLKSLVGKNCPILIDQEGGRVARLKPPHWNEYPNMEVFAKLAIENLEQAKSELSKNISKIAKDLTKIGINVNCAPVCDILVDGCHDIVGDRCFGDDIEVVSSLARTVAETFIDNKIAPIIKHIPGHGRAKADSHLELPMVETSLEVLKETDFKVFKNLSDMPLAMTAHILYSAIDKENCATHSKKIIDYIRDDIGYKNLIMTDDLSMQALEGDFSDRTTKSYEAGCDIILHCNGKMSEMEQIAKSVQIMQESKVDFIDSYLYSKIS